MACFPVGVAAGDVAGLLKWKDSSIRDLDDARSQSVAAARDSVVAVLTFRFDTVDHDVAATREKLTGNFLDHVHPADPAGAHP